MNKTDFKAGLETLGFKVETLETTGMIYGRIDLTPIPYKDDRGYKLIPWAIRVCDMGGVDKGEHMGCVSCSVYTTVKRPYGREWQADGETHKFCIIDNGQPTLMQEIKAWMEEFQACKRDWEYMK